METKPLMHQHGGDLDAIERKYGIPKAEILDFSGNINPLGFPESVKTALAQNLDIISTYPDKHYTALREASGAYTGANPAHIVVGNGSTELIGTFIKTVNAKKSLIMGPAYSEYEREVSLTGGTFDYFPLKAEDDFVIDLDALLAALTPEIGMFVACNPNNPTGYLYTRKEMNRIRDLVKKYDLFLFSDEVYREFIYTGSPYISACHLEGIEQNVVLIDSVSKRYSECGIRIGALITKNRTLRNAVMKFCQARLSPPLIGQIVAEASIDAPRSYSTEVYEEYIERRKCLIDGLNRLPGVYSPIPMGAFYTVARLPVEDSDDFCAWCLSDFDYEGETVMLAPASGFYSDPACGRNEVRIAYVLKKEDLERALVVLGKALEAYNNRK